MSVDPLSSRKSTGPASLRALRHRSFRYFLLGQAVSVVGSWMQQAALSWHVQLLKGVDSAFWLGMTAAAASLPIVVFAPLGGSAADRFAKRRLILATQAAAMVAAFAFAALIYLGWATIPWVLLFAAINGTVLAYDIPARQAFAVEMVGRDDLLGAIALNSAVFNLGRLAGPMVFGWVISLGMGTCFLLNGLSFLGVLVALAYMPDAPISPLPRKDPGDLLTGFRVIAADRRLLALVAVLGAVLLTGATYFTLLPALAQNHLGVGDQGYSLLLSANGLGALLGSLAVASLSSLSARRPTIVTGVILMTIGLAGLAWVDRLAGATFFVWLTGGGFILFLASTNSTVQLSVPDHVRGRVMSVWVLMFGLCQPIGNFAAGSIADMLGTPRTLGIESIACLVAALLALAALAIPESRSVSS